MDKKVLIDIAKEAIESKFNKKTIDKERLIKENPELAKEGAVFVTLKQHGHLRGCIGSIIAHRPLIDDLIHNAQSSAFNDPRFSPLKESELKDTDIEISLLSPYKEVEYKDIDELKKKIRPNIDGVILKLGLYQATFLPQVWEELPTFELFFAHLCQKAGLNSSCLENHPNIYTYQVEKIEQ
ncbi:MAG: AmmeMemoRadiSam system protein A [Epsilonproteobacteria bacterium]|nr:AmmeMemoRadiSam system protein A [Campylobacterota bacterium]